MEASKTDQVLAGLVSIFNRELTDDERASVVYWEKCRELSHFIEGFPNEWKLFKEMLLSYLDDFTAQWGDIKKTNPSSVGNLEVIHAQVWGADKVVTTFISDVENSPALAKEVPETIKEGYTRLKSMPQDI